MSFSAKYKSSVVVNYAEKGLFGILNKEQGMRKLNDEGILFAIVVLARVPRVSLPSGLRPTN